MLNKNLASEKFVANTSADSDILRKGEALFIAFLIELGNRYGPQGIFVFIMGLAAASPSKAAEPEAAREPEPETRKSEISTGNDAPASPRKRRKAPEMAAGNQQAQRPKMWKAHRLSIFGNDRRERKFSPSWTAENGRCRKRQRTSAIRSAISGTF